MVPVDPEEVESLTGTSRAPAGERVAERDFGQPLRLGAARLTAVRRRFEAAAFRVGNDVSDALGRPYEVALVGLREVHADVARDGLAEPLAAVRFTVAGQLGWAVWDSASAVRAVERLLCGSAPKNADRALSALETDLVAGVLATLVAAAAQAAEVEHRDLRPARALGTLGTWQEVGEAADPHRVALDLLLRTGPEQSELTVYLPGLPRTAAAEPAPPAELPGHLDRVAVELSARLGEVEIPLADLLALEDGDVISLGTPIHGTLAVTVDGVELGRGVLGTSGGKLAVRLTDVHHPPTRSQQPAAAPPATPAAPKTDPKPERRKR